MNLLQYIKRPHKGKEAHRLELETMKDPFLSDAFEGINGTEGGHFKRIQLLQKRITAKTRKKRRFSLPWFGMGVSILVFSVGSYFLFQKESNIRNLHSTNLNTTDKNIEAEPVATTKEKTTTAKALSAKRTKAKSKTEKAANPTESKPKSKEKDITPKMSAETPPTSPEASTTQSHKAENRITAKGQIINEAGQAIVGATVVLDGTVYGTISDISGNFEIETNGEERLAISYQGLDPVKVPIKSSDRMLITMHKTKRETQDSVEIEKQAPVRMSKPVIPEPVLGKESFDIYIRNNRKQPEDNECSKKKGKVVVNFFVNEKGRPRNIYVQKSLCQSIDQEAIRLVKEGPDWTLGDKEVSLTIRF